MKATKRKQEFLIFIHKHLPHPIKDMQKIRKKLIVIEGTQPDI